MPEKAAIVLVKRFTYRDQPEEWSNKYHFAETPPSTPAAWKTLVDALSAKEKTLYTGATKIVRAYCYEEGDADSVYTVDYTALSAEISGTGAVFDGHMAPGDTAMVVRWDTPDRNSRGRKIYLRKYLHGCQSSNADIDKVDANEKTAADAYAVALQGGTGAITGFTICGPHGAVASAGKCMPFLTTRTLKRRGKRPPTS